MGKILGIVHVEMPVQVEAGADSGTESEEKRSLMHRLDELDAMIKPLEDEYRRTAVELMRISK